MTASASAKGKKNAATTLLLTGAVLIVMPIAQPLSDDMLRNALIVIGVLLVLGGGYLFSERLRESRRAERARLDAESLRRS